MKPSRLVLGLTLLAFALALGMAQAPVCASQRSEESLGREYAAELEKQCRLVTDEAVLERVRRIGETLAKIANEYEVPAQYGSSEIYKFDYQFKVIEDKDVNALSLPGGIIYVNTGLLELVESDDELAGVIAHEIAHAAHHHMSQLLRKRSAADRYIALVALAGILGNARGRDLNNLLLGAQMMRIGKLSSYTQEAEKDADRAAVAYLAKSPYKAEGMLSFMRKLEVKHDQNPTAPLGIFQTHPAPFRRAAAITKAMQEEGLNPDMRRLSDIAYAKSAPVSEGDERFRVVIGNRTVCEPATLECGTSSKERADQIAERINALLDSGVTLKDIREDRTGTRLLARDVEILRIENEDATQTGEDKEQIIERARTALAYAVWADWLHNECIVTREVLALN